MKIDYRYDGTFPGLLSVIFEIYASKRHPSSIERIYRSSEGLFSNTYYVQTEESHSKRVLAGLEKKLSSVAIRNLYKTMLTEIKGAEMHIYGMIRHALANVKNIETDYRNQHVSEVSKLSKKVNKEVHRMHAFVRFQKTADDMYVATITPDYDVIPLIGNHFEQRYKDQEWLIYDIKRGYGLHYDFKKVSVIQLNNIALDKNKKLSKSILDEKEDTFQRLWQQYFESTNIPERKNLRLHLQHVPKRYWKYLPEKGEF
ncbi:MAG: TIGR03915 family putative DNA repair protein [Cyclobacteriaceae bacterium]